MISKDYRSCYERCLYQTSHHADDQKDSKMPLLALLCGKDPFHRELEDYISHVQVLKGKDLNDYHEKPIAH